MKKARHNDGRSVEAILKCGLIAHVTERMAFDPVEWTGEARDGANAVEL
jgi:hypothetical protein